MSLQKIIKEVSQRSNIDEKSGLKVLKNFCVVLGETFVKGELKFSLPGVGSFYLLETKSRKNRNPHNGEMMIIPAKKLVRFKSSSKLISDLNN